MIVSGKYKKRVKGQIFSTDFLIGIIVVLFTITTLQVHQRGMMNEIRHQQRMVYRDTLISKTDVLLNFEGIPDYWEAENVEVPGLSTGNPNHLNQTKVEYFFEMDVAEVEKMLGFRGRDIHISLKDGAGDVIVSDTGTEFELGEETWSESSNVYNIERKAFLGADDRSVVYLNLVVW